MRSAYETTGLESCWKETTDLEADWRVLVFTVVLKRGRAVHKQILILNTFGEQQMKSQSTVKSHLPFARPIDLPGQPNYADVYANQM